MVDYNTVVIVNGFRKEMFYIVLGFIYLSKFRIPILVILSRRNDVLRNIRFDSNKCVLRMISLKEWNIYLIWFKYIEYFLSVENKWFVNYLLLNKYGNAFPIWNELFWDFIFKDEIRCGKLIWNCFQMVKCGNFISSKDILEDEIIWKIIWNLMMLRIFIDS